MSVSADPCAITDGALPVSARPLCVDLDGTLIASDMLVESAIRTATQGPVKILGLLQSLRQSRAALKAMPLITVFLT